MVGFKPVGYDSAAQGSQAYSIASAIRYSKERMILWLRNQSPCQAEFPAKSKL